ncbi:MAG: hypothetical protein GX786_02635 [Clostridiales bacterium]|nr:hypothetical protein [Clostridiales bacterium]
MGRVIWGIVNTIISTRGDSPFTWALFFSGAFVSAIIGIVVQVAFIPPIVLIFKKSKLQKKMR